VPGMVKYDIKNAKDKSPNRWTVQISHPPIDLCMNFATMFFLPEKYLIGRCMNENN
jgi:hypothetical protein